jgi:hypothetical protein
VVLQELHRLFVGVQQLGQDEGGLLDLAAGAQPLERGAIALAQDLEQVFVQRHAAVRRHAWREVYRQRLARAGDAEGRRELRRVGVIA